MFFVVSTGRSGTKSIARTLDHHPFCYCINEGHRFLIRLATEYMHSQIGTEELRSYLAQQFPYRVGFKLYGESNQKLSYIIPLLAEFGTNTRFIWLIRDGRSFVASVHARGWYGDERVSPPPNPWSANRIQGDRSGEISSEVWADMSLFEKCC